jgi:hypothetical protein
MSVRGCLALVLLFCSFDASAQPVKTLSGRWSASTLRTSWTAEPWGAACGPRPTATSEAGGIVAITQSGNELSISGVGRTYSSSGCWEAIPNGRIISHTASAGAIRTVCQSAAGDPRRSAITTTLSLTEDRIELVEAGQFEYAIGNDTCHAVMRRSRSYSIVEREGESRPSPNEGKGPDNALVIATPSQAVAAEPKGRDCSEKGPPQKIEVSPARKLLRAGDEYVFRVRVVDKAGCALDRTVTWSKVTTDPSILITPQGKIKIKEQATEGQFQLVASLQELKVAVTVDVVSEARYQALLSGGVFDSEGETKESAVTTSVSSTVGAKAAVLEAAAQKRRVVFIWIIGGLSLLLASIATWLFLSRRKLPKVENTLASMPPLAPLSLNNDNYNNDNKALSILVCPTCHEEYAGDQKFCAVDGNRLIELPAQIHLAGAEGGVCPVCRHGFDPGVSRCPTHDEELVPAAALMENPTNRVTAGRRICPVCGSLYGPETQFCGNDGAALVPIN